MTTNLPIGVEREIVALMALAVAYLLVYLLTVKYFKWSDARTRVGGDCYWMGHFYSAIWPATFLIFISIAVWLLLRTIFVMGLAFVDWLTESQ